MLRKLVFILSGSLLFLCSPVSFAADDLSFSLTLDGWYSDAGLAFESASPVQASTDDAILPRLGAQVAYKKFTFGLTKSFKTEYDGTLDARDSQTGESFSVTAEKSVPMHLPCQTEPSFLLTN